MKKILIFIFFYGGILLCMEQQSLQKEVDFVGNLRVLYRNNKVAWGNGKPINTLPPIAELASQNSIAKPEKFKNFSNVAFSAVTDMFIMLGYRDGVIEFLDTAKLEVYAAGKIVESPIFLTLSADNKYLVVTEDVQPLDAGKIFVYNLQDPRKCTLVKELTGHVGAVQQAHCINDFLITTSYDATIKVWDLRDFTKTSTLVTKFDHSHPPSIIVTPDGNYLFSYSMLDGVYIWDIRDPAKIKHISSIQTEAWNIKQVFAKDAINYCLLVGSRSFSLYSLEKPEIPAKKNTLTHEHSINTMILSNDMRSIVCGSNNGTLYYGPLENQQEVKLSFATLDDKHIVTALCFSDDTTLFAGTLNGMIYSWNCSDFKRLLLKYKFQAHDNKSEAITKIVCFNKILMIESKAGLVSFWRLS